MEKENNNPLIPDNLHFHCIVCDEKIDLQDDLVKRCIKCPPVNAVHFTASWSTGSQIWDNYPVAHLMICDGCFVKKSHRMLMEDEDKKTGKRKVIKVQEYLISWFDNFRNSDNGMWDDYFKNIMSYFKNIY